MITDKYIRNSLDTQYKAAAFRAQVDDPDSKHWHDLAIAECKQVGRTMKRPEFLEWLYANIIDRPLSWREVFRIAKDHNLEHGSIIPIDEESAKVAELYYVQNIPLQEARKMVEGADHEAL